MRNDIFVPSRAAATAVPEHEQARQRWRPAAGSPLADAIEAVAGNGDDRAAELAAENRRILGELGRERVRVAGEAFTADVDARRRDAAVLAGLEAQQQQLREQIAHMKTARMVAQQRLHGLLARLAYFEQLIAERDALAARLGEQQARGYGAAPTASLLAYTNEQIARRRPDAEKIVGRPLD